MDDQPTDSELPAGALAGDDRSRRLRERLWRAVGTVSVAIGLFNAFVPLLPTVVFLLVGVWAYGKGAPELRAKLLAHPHFGPALQLWQERRAIRRDAKLKAIGSIAFSYAVTLAIVGVNTVTVLVGAMLALVSLWLGMRPED